MDDDFDAILGDIGVGDEDLIEEVSKPTPVSDPAPESSSVPVEQDDDIPALVGQDYPIEFKTLVERVQYQYKCLPILNYPEIYEELSDLAIKSHPSPTLQIINDEIQKVQAAKERLSEIYRDVERNFFLKKRSIDILESAWAKYTSEKSADKRKGDAVMRVSNFVTDFALTECCYRVCQHIIKNLDSCHESLSRQITVNQLLLKMNDYGRGGLPDYDYEDKKRENDESMVSDDLSDDLIDDSNDSIDDSNELSDEHF